MRLPSTARVGLLALVLGVLVFVPLYFWVNTRTFVPVDIYRWSDILSTCFWIAVFCEFLGVALLLLAFRSRLEARSFEDIRLRIFRNDLPPAPAPPADFKSWPWLQIVGLSAVGTGVALLAATKYWPDAPIFVDLSSDLQVLSLLLFGTGFSVLYGCGFSRLTQRPQTLPLSLAFPGEKPAWGITRLRFRQLPARRTWAVNPLLNIPTIALVCVIFLLGLFSAWVMGSTMRWGSRGLYVSVLRKDVPVSRTVLGMTAPIIQIDAGRHVLLNYKPTTWEKLPDDLEHALRGVPVRVVYFDGDNDILFMDAARALDIVHRHDARVILLTPGSRAALFP